MMGGITICDGCEQPYRARQTVDVGDEGLCPTCARKRDDPEFAGLLEAAVDGEGEETREALLRQIPPERALDAFGWLEAERQRLLDQERMAREKERT